MPRRALRVIGHTAHTVALVVTFVVAFVVGVVLHIDMPSLRRGAVARVGAELASIFQGRLAIDSVGTIDLGGIGGIREGNARVFDPSGKLVAAAYGVRAKIELVELLRSVFGSGPLVVHLTHVTVRAVDFDLGIEGGTVGIARAFTPREPSTGGPPGRGVIFTIDHVEVAHAWVHGVVASGLAIDADADHIKGKVEVSPSQITVDVASLSLLTRSMPLHADALGTAEGQLAIPAPGGGAVGAKVVWNGTVAGLAESATASIDGDALEATVDAPELSPAALRVLWPASPIDGPATGHIDVKGTLPKLQVHARSTQGAASFDVTGPIVLGAGQTADLHFDARAIDLHTVVSSAPVSNLGATGDVSLARSAAGALSAKGAILFAGGEIAGARVPKGKISATLSKDVGAGVRADATVAADEPGAPTSLRLRLAPKGRSYELGFSTDTHVPSLDAVPRLGPVARGKSEVKTNGVIDFDRGALDVKLNAEILGLGHDVMSVEHANVDLKVRGSLAAPQIDVRVRGDILDFGGYKFSSAELEVHGPASGAHLQASLDADGDGTPDLEGEGELSLGSVTTVDRIKVHIARASEHVAIHVGEVRIAHGELAIDPIVIDGLGGAIVASFHSDFGSAHIQVKGDGVDLARFARVSRVEEGVEGCMATFDVDTTVHRDGGDGHVVLELSKCSLGSVNGLSLGLNATLAGRRISGRAHAELEDVGELVITSSAIQIGGTGSFAQSWKQAFGQAKFDGKLDMAKLAARLPRKSVPLDHLKGTITLAGRIERDSPTDNTPGLNLSASTSGLVLIGPSVRTTGVDGTAVIAPPAWRVDGIDVGVDARIDGDSGFAALAVRLSDAIGPLVAVDLKSGAVPYNAILDKPARALSLLENVPFNLHVGVPARDAKTLPPVFALKGVRGTIQADLDATGTLLKPVADLRAKVVKGRVPEGVSFPVDFDLTSHYDGAHLSAALSGLEKDRKVVEGSADVEVAAAELLHGQTSAWTGSGRVHLDALKLQSIQALSDHQVTGMVTGDVTVDGLHSDGRATLAIAIDSLKVGDIAYRNGTVSAKIDGKTLGATAHLDQADGSVDLTAQAATEWGTALVPKLDPAHSPTGELKAKNLRAALFLPFVDDTFTELDGRVDGDLKITVDPRTGVPQAQGSLAVSDGRFELASIGGEFHGVTGSAVFTPDGVVKVEGVKAYAMSGRVEAAASARLNGLALSSANAVVQIPSSSPVLLTVQGAQVGTVDGRVNVGVTANAKAIDVKAAIPSLHVELPLTSTRDIQPLGEMEGVRIGLEKGKGEFVAERLDAPHQAVVAPAGKTITLTIALGNDVLIKKSTQLSVGLAGSPVITISDRVRASGQVRLLAGKIDVQGKSFDIDSGTVTFQGDPSDPQVVVTASWSAADGTKVYADLRGTLKSPKVTLRSEPAYSQNEILALLIYGSADASNPNAQGSGTAQTYAAAGVAGGAATQPLNSALTNMGLGGVSARVDTSASTPRADVEVQIARSLSLQIAQVLGVPPPGTNPDTTLFTLSLRFAKAWAAQTTVGTAGTTIWDMVWQYRY